MTSLPIRASCVLVCTAAVAGVLALAPGCSDDASGGGSGGGANASGGASFGGSTGGGDCSLMLPGATGNEPDGMIPVCCTPGGVDRALVDELLVLVNDYRATNGLEPYAVDPGLEAAMQGHCLHMASHDFFDHEAPEAVVASPWDRAELCGSSASAENIAWGNDTAASALEQWMGSPGHNANVLGDHARVGIGHSGDYWGMIFD